MPNDIQKEAQARLHGLERERREFRRVHNVIGTVAAVALSPFGLGPIAYAAKMVMNGIAHLNTLPDDYERELQKVVRGERDTLPDVPEVVDNSHLMAGAG